MGGTADTAKLRPLNAGGSSLKPQSAPATTGAAGGAGLRILKFFTALALIPACVGLTLGVHDHAVASWPHIDFSGYGASMMLKWFAIGALSFGVLVILLWRPVVVYVFGHELIHALATWMCLGRVTNLTASTYGGQVTTSKSNTFIRLAPYCVPLYALLAWGVYLGLDHWWQPLGARIHWLACGLGFFYAFHIGFTLWSLRRDQPDLKPDGWLFSLVVIYFANILIFASLLGFLCGGQAHDAWSALKDSCVMGWQNTTHIYQKLGQIIKAKF